MNRPESDQQVSRQEGMRIEAKDLRCQNRQHLQDVLPLITPFVVYIDPTNVCNFRCKFCPTGDPSLLEQVGRTHASMSLDHFKKTIDDLREFPDRLKLLNLYKDGEPLVNKHFPAMVKYAREARIAERIWTKTNGSLLGPEINSQLVDAGLDMICISVEGVSSEAYQKIAGLKIDYDKFISNLRNLFIHRGAMDIYIKIADSGLNQKEIDRFYSDFGPISTHIAIEKLMGWSNSGLKDFTLGTHPDTYDGLPFVPKTVCAYPFYVMAVNADGSVSVCGNDWSYVTSVGNVFQQSLKSVWEGTRLRAFQRMMLEDRRCENAACSDCYYIKIVPDNLDPFRHQLLEKYT